MKSFKNNGGVICLYLLSHFFHIIILACSIFIASTLRGKPFWGVSYFACISCEQVLTDKTIGNFIVISSMYVLSLVLYYFRKNKLNFEIVTLLFLPHFTFTFLYFINPKIEKWFCSDINFFSMQQNFHISKVTFFAFFSVLYLIIVLKKNTIKPIIFRIFLSFVSFGLYFVIFSKTYRFIF